MGRWEPGAAKRLEEAAMDLYEQRGYDQTTVEDIAQRAGLTERTFFRHYADKREVLFGGSADLRESLVREVARAPEWLSPLQATAAGLVAIGALLQERRGRDFARRRQQILAQSPDLQERELIKMASWAEGVTEALRSRGVEAPDASLVAEVGVAAFRVAFGEWVGAVDRQELQDPIRESFDRLSQLSAGRPQGDPWRAAGAAAGPWEGRSPPPNRSR